MRNEKSITVGDLMDAVASRSFGPVLVVPALIAILPLIGAIPGMTTLTGKTGTRATALVCVGLGLIMLPSALLPFAVMAPASAVLFLALGMTATDGLMVLIGFILSAGSAVAAVWYLVPYL